MSTKKIILIFGVFLSNGTFAQNVFKAVLINSETKEVLREVSCAIKGSAIGGNTDINGKITITNIPDGKQTLSFQIIGYEKLERSYLFPLADSLQDQSIYLQPETREMEEIIVSSTRTNSRIEDVPVKMEVVALDEIEEMTGINPNNVSMLLTEASGVQQQITSATSGNINARIYGLDGQYTQLVKDGFPMFSGYSSGFSIMQIPPLDLKQIEIIKGAASALYGGDAIAGVMNLVSKSPSFERDCSLLLNQTQKGGTDFSGYYSKRNKKFGIALLATQNFQQAVDVNRDGFSDIPKTRLTTVSPKFFFYPNKTTTISLLLNTTFDDRAGGDILAIKHKPDTAHSYIDRNTTDRIYSQLKCDKEFGKKTMLTLKNALGYYNRSINTGNYSFGGYQVYSYSEASFYINLDKHKMVIGSNVNTDRFSENKELNPNTPARDYNYITTGLFIQDDWSIGKKIILETGLRSDYQNRFKAFTLPRASVMYKLNQDITLRTGAGMGYKAPTIFSTGYEQNAYYNVRTLPLTSVAEKSYGINGDINLKHNWTNIGFNINQAFFYTQINASIVPNADSLTKGIYYYSNAVQPFQTKGMETNIRVRWKKLNLHTGYTLTDAVKKYQEGNQSALFVARNRVITDAFYCIRNWEIGLEAFYTGKQYIGAEEYGKGYWDFAFMLAYKFKKATILFNAENFTDRRQTRWEQVVIPPYSKPSFRPVYAPLNGMVANLSLRIRI